MSADSDNASTQFDPESKHCTVHLLAQELLLWILNEEFFELGFEFCFATTTASVTGTDFATGKK